uniref:Uncharacterized protein n=1 Tax=viral metagenome TaxID=1070528 RepID=A0A6C0JQ19_9ZZZZ
MKEKDVNMLMGINDSNNLKLIENGYTKAYQILGMLLLFNKNKNLFVEWLESMNINPFDAKKCYQCLIDWCDQHL